MTTKTKISMKNNISQSVDSIMSTIEVYISQGKEKATFRWIKEHQLLGHVQKESTHELKSISRKFIEENVKYLTDYHIL